MRQISPWGDAAAQPDGVARMFAIGRLAQSRVPAEWMVITAMNPDLPANQFSDEMWDLLEQCGQEEGALRTKLATMPRDSIVALYKEFYRAMRSLWDRLDASDFFDLAPSAEEQISEDGKQDIYSFVVSNGRDYYNHISSHPEDLRTNVDPGDVPFVWVPGEVFWDRFNEEISDQ